MCPTVALRFTVGYWCGTPAGVLVGRGGADRGFRTSLERFRGRFFRAALIPQPLLPGVEGEQDLWRGGGGAFVRWVV